MTEIWLRSNRRAIAFGMVLPGMVGIAGLLLAIGVGGHSGPKWLRVVGGIAACVCLSIIAALFQQLGRPRLAYRQGELLVGLRFGVPIAVPINAVECFFLGQAPSMLPGRAESAARSLVIRLAETASNFAERDVKPSLGHWCDGYITIRGTWCEPLSFQLAQRLNQRLLEAKRDQARSPTQQ